MIQKHQYKNTDGKGPKPEIVISGIGTGGHYFPGIVVALELLRRNCEVIFLVRKGFLEEKAANLYGLRTFKISARPFYGKSILIKFLFIFSFVYSIYRLGPITKKNIGFSFGGFGSLPLIVSCLINRRPFYLFEPNTIAGRATKLFAGYARKVFLGMPAANKINGELLITGIPIRAEFKKSFQKFESLKKTILFIGGSQGSKRLNRLALEIGEIIPKDWEIVIISGHRDYDWVKHQKNSRTSVIPFTHTPWQEIKDSGVVVSRSGALAGYEILALKKKVIFIPFPFAVDNHQYYNGKYFTRLGNAMMLEEKNLTKEILVEKIGQLIAIKDKESSEIMLDAEKRIVDEIEKDLIYEADTR